MNNTNTVKLIVDRTAIPVPALPPGKMFNRNLVDDDFVPADGKVLVKVQVVLGNKQYRSGVRLDLYLDPTLPS
jgi:hypothetical protein